MGKIPSYTILILHLRDPLSPPTLRVNLHFDSYTPSLLSPTPDSLAESVGTTLNFWLEGFVPLQ